MKTPFDLRSQMPFLQNLTYLDSASVIPCPMPVIESMNEYFREFPFNYGVGEFSASRRMTAKVDAARAKVAAFINAHAPQDIVFTKNTTEAINLAASGIDWQAGDEIIITNLEHQSNIMPWMRVQQEKAVVLKIVWAKPDGLVDPDDVRKLISRRTKLISITHVSNIFGTIQPVREVGQIAKQADALFMVDAAQSGGRVPIDVQNIGCDLLSLCGRKSLMGPQGTGALYVREQLQGALRPLNIGSRAGSVTGHQTYKLNAAPNRFESGVLNTSGVIGLGRAIDCLAEIGVENILRHIQGLTRQMLDVLMNTKGIEVYGCKTPDRLAGIISWNISGRKSSDIAKQLDEAKKIAVASGPNGSALAIEPLGVKEIVRTSVSYFNTSEDIECLREGLQMIAQ